MDTLPSTVNSEAPTSWAALSTLPPTSWLQRLVWPQGLSTARRLPGLRRRNACGCGGRSSGLRRSMSRTRFPCFASLGSACSSFSGLSRGANTLLGTLWSAKRSVLLFFRGSSPGLLLLGERGSLLRRRPPRLERPNAPVSRVTRRNTPRSSADRKGPSRECAASAPTRKGQLQFVCTTPGVKFVLVQ